MKLMGEAIASHSARLEGRKSNEEQWIIVHVGTVQSVAETMAESNCTTKDTLQVRGRGGRVWHGHGGRCSRRQ